MPSQAEPKQRIGDAVAELARRYSLTKNGCEFATTLRNGRLTRPRYLGYIAMMYPNVVGFNRALIRSIAKVDHVRQSGFVKALAEQLREEQDHNALWRTKLEIYGIDHEAVYETFMEYVSRFTYPEMDRRTADVLAALGPELKNLSPGCFPKAPFPEPVIALYHYLWMSAAYDEIDYWEHYASQSGIEFIIYDVVSTSIYPGVAGNPELDAGPGSLQWWKEHAKQGGVEGMRSDEEKHLELAQIMLNRSAAANGLQARVRERAESTMRLFVATMMCHDIGSGTYPVEQFYKQARGYRLPTPGRQSRTAV